MKNKTRRFLAIVSISVGLLMPLNMASADSASFKQLSAEWWQWVLSIPASDNPLLDNTGAQCVVGQRGATWFLAGNLGGTTVRTCSLPEGTVLFFPVVNSVSFDTANACGQGPEKIPVKDLRATSAAFIAGATNVWVELDGKAMRDVHHVESQVFALALPEENVFDPFCPPPGLPAGIYSPAVDEGFYVRLEPPGAGNHSLHIHAENPSADFTLDVTYHLTIGPVVQK